MTRRPQTLLVFRGPVGIGKSALSRAVGERLGWPVVDKDDFSDVLMARVENYGPLAYESMFSAARSLLRQGFNVIVDSPLRGEVGYRKAERLALETEAALRIVACGCSDEQVWQRRVETRERRPAHVVKTWDDLKRYREGARTDFNDPTPVPTLAIDTVDPLSKTAEQVVGWLGTVPTSS